MKIALICLHFAEYSLRLATSLVQRNDVLLILRLPNRRMELGEFDHYIIPQRLQIYELPKYPLKNPRTLLNSAKIAKRVKRFDPDIIHVQEVPQVDLAIAMRILKEYPFVLTIHDHISHIGRDSKFSLQRILSLRYLRKSCDAVIVHGKKIKYETGRLLNWIDSSAIYSINHGVLGIPCGFSENISPEPNSVLFFGRVEKYKGLGVLIDAVDILVKSGIKIKIVIAGEGSDLEHQKYRITGDSNWEIVEGFASSESVRHMMLSSEIVVMPYIDGTQSGVAAMAIGYGRPIVATDVGSISEVVIDGYNGIIVPPNRSDALAEALGDLLSNSAKRSAMSNHARALSNTDLSWDRIARETQRVYEETVLSETL